MHGLLRLDSEARRSPLRMPLFVRDLHFRVADDPSGMVFGVNGAAILARVREVPRSSIRKSSGFVNAPCCPFMGLGLFGNFTICGIFVFRMPVGLHLSSITE